MPANQQHCNFGTLKKQYLCVPLLILLSFITLSAGTFLYIVLCKHVELCCLLLANNNLVYRRFAFYCDKESSESLNAAEYTVACLIVAAL